MRPLITALALATAFLPAPTARAQSSSAEFEQAIAGALDSVYMLGVARRGGAGPEVFQFIGTGWVIAEGKLATNAHVAEALLESSLEGRLVAKRSWSDRDELSLSAASIRIHPAYGPWNARLKRVVVRNENDPAAARSMSFIPVADVAIVEVEAGNTATPLTLSDPAQVEPVLSEPVVYLGFPHENISGFPTLHAVPGHVTAKTDFFFQRSAWSDSYLIHYCGPVVGGASGSPMLNRAGQVIGLISAAENNLSANGERTSFGFAYGQRIDLARELLRDDFAAVQAERDGNWSLRLANLLLPPDELLEQMALGQSAKDGVPQLAASNTVTRRQVTVKQSESARLQVTLEPGLRYGFLAAAHDGSDIDAQVISREGDEVLGVDVQGDYFPVVWIGPLAERRAVTFEVAASERLLRDTQCSVHVYKYAPQVVAVEQEDGSFLDTTVTLADEQGALSSWSFHAEAGAQLFFSAESADGYDIDLFAALDGEIISSDETPDAVPVLMFTLEKAGTLELRLRVPQGAAAGSEVAVKGLHFGGPKPVAISGGALSGAARVFTLEELSAQLDGVLADVWTAAGATGETVFQSVTQLDDLADFEFDIPAGTLPVFAALAPLGQDIDLKILVDGQVVFEDSDADANPMGAIPAADVPRKATLRLIELNPEVKVEQVIYRYCLLRR